MNDKLQESAQYLRCCSNLEIEAFKLYETLSKKINQPENSFILGIAYDSLKCAKIIQGILDYFDLPDTENMNCKKNMSELATKMTRFSKRISRTNNLNYEISCEILRELTILEDRLSETYTNYLQSSASKIVADEFSRLAVNLSNFKKIFETFIEQKQKHRETLIEIKYCFEVKESERLKQLAPIVKYPDPDSWIQDSTIHAFPNGSVEESTESPNQTVQPTQTPSTSSSSDRV
jgi:hypothetical protein